MERDSQAGGSSRLRRELGLPQLTVSGVGIIVGAGVYVLIAPATEEAGGLVWLAFLLGALLGGLTGLSYCELAAMFPSAAGEYTYTRQAFPEWFAFVVGWMMVAALAIAAPAVALGFGEYARRFVDVDARLLGAGLLVVDTLVALMGIKHSARLTVVLGIVQVGGLVAVAVVGFGHLGDHDLVHSERGAMGVLGAAALVFFAFIGFDEVATLAEETKRPSRTVPAALLLALGVSALLYVSVAIGAVSVLGADALSRSSQPLADVMAEVTGSRSGDITAVIAMLTTANTTLLVLTAASRMIYGIAAAGSYPPVFARVAASTGVPWVALLASAAIACAFLFTGGLAFIASVTDVAIYFIFLAVNATVVRLRWLRPEAPRPFRVPLAVGWLPLPPVLGSLFVLLMMTRLEPGAIALACGLAATGLVASVVAANRRRALAARAP